MRSVNTYHADPVIRAARVEYLARRRKNKPTTHRLVEWSTTTPHPTRPAHTHGADDGQVGWRLHLVFGLPEHRASRWASIRPRAICGADAKHGWGLDLFIEEPCARCLKAIARRGLTPPPLPIS